MKLKVAIWWRGEGTPFVESIFKGKNLTDIGSKVEQFLDTIVQERRKFISAVDLLDGEEHFIGRWRVVKSENYGLIWVFSFSGR